MYLILIIFVLLLCFGGYSYHGGHWGGVAGYGGPWGGGIGLGGLVLLILLIMLLTGRL